MADSNNTSWARDSRTPQSSPMVITAPDPRDVPPPPVAPVAPVGGGGRNVMPPEVMAAVRGAGGVSLPGFEGEMGNVLTAAYKISQDRIEMANRLSLLQGLGMLANGGMMLPGMHGGSYGSMYGARGGTDPEQVNSKAFMDQFSRNLDRLSKDPKNTADGDTLRKSALDATMADWKTMGQQLPSGVLSNLQNDPASTVSADRGGVGGVSYSAPSNSWANDLRKQVADFYLAELQRSYGRPALANSDDPGFYNPSKLNAAVSGFRSQLANSKSTTAPLGGGGNDVLNTPLDAVRFGFDKKNMSNNIGMGFNNPNMLGDSQQLASSGGGGEVHNEAPFKSSFNPGMMFPAAYLGAKALAPYTNPNKYPQSNVGGAVDFTNGF